MTDDIIIIIAALIFMIVLIILNLLAGLLFRIFMPPKLSRVLGPLVLGVVLILVDIISTVLYNIMPWDLLSLTDFNMGILTCIIIWWGYIIIKFANFILWEGLFTVNGVQFVPKLIVNIINIIIYFIALLLVIKFCFHQNITEVLVASGAAALILGYGAQHTIANIISGITISLDKNINIGDWIKLGDDYGKIINMDWRAINMLDPQENCVVIPNSVFSSSVCKVSTRPTTSRVLWLDFKVPATIRPDVFKSLVRKTEKTMTTILDGAIKTSLINYEDNFNKYRVEIPTTLPKDAQILDQFLTSIHYKLARIDLDLRAHNIVMINKIDKPEQEIDQQQIINELSKVNDIPMFNYEEIMTIIDHSSVYRYGSNELIIEEGSTNNYLFYLLTGSLSVQVHTEEERTVEVAQLHAGTIMGEMSLFLDQKAACDIRVCAESQVLKISHATIKQIVKNRPEICDLFETLIQFRMKNNKDFLNKFEEQQSKEKKNQKPLSLANFIRNKFLS